jgi:geranylgeranylglycerol-phosphate geranylgeranyltransferase
MSSEKIKALIQLCRPVNVLITFVSIPAAIWLAVGTACDILTFFLAASSGALVAAGANAMNDAFDIEIDKINRPDRPLPRGALTRVDARNMWLLTSFAAICINLFFNLFALSIVLFAVLLLYYYSARLKRSILAGNITVGLMTGMAFMYGGAVVEHTDRTILPAIFAFLINVARELVKDVEDREGDKKEHAVTFAVRYGIRPSLTLATLLLLILISVTLIVAYSSFYNGYFTYIVLTADILLCTAGVMMWQDSSSVMMRRVSTILKFSMAVGLLAIITGSL